MRTFIGIDLPDEVKADLFGLKERLSPFAEQGRWTSRYNYHLNLKFLGEITEEKQSAIEARLEEICSKASPFELSISTVGAFGLDTGLSVRDKSGMKTLWMGVSGNTEALKALHFEIEMALTKEHFSANLRDYSPHIALGENMIFNCDFRHIRKEMSGLNKVFTVDQICLFKSVHEGARRTYSLLSTHKLGLE